MSRHLVVSHGDHELAGVVRDGESWYAAARRTAASTTGEPVPIDLSADPMRWTVDHDLLVLLRPMTRGDLPSVARWRAQGHVDRWWHADGPATLERVTEAYGADIDGTTPTRMWVVEANGRSVGFLQDYRIRDYPDYALLTPDPDAMCCDYAIGEPEWVGRGLGLRMIWAWALRTVHRFPDVTALFAAPDHRNTASLRMLEKAGFVQGTWFDEPESDGSVVTVVGCTLDVRRVLSAEAPAAN